MKGVRHTFHLGKPITDGLHQCEELGCPAFVIVKKNRIIEFYEEADFRA